MAMVYRIEVNVIDVACEITFVAQRVLPIASLPNAPFVERWVSQALNPSYDAGFLTAAKPTNDINAKIATTASTAGSELRSATKASASGAIACITRYGPPIRPIMWP